MDLDPITIDIVRYKLDGIAGEMQPTPLRSSFSPIVKEGLDASASLFAPVSEAAGRPPGYSGAPPRGIIPCPVDWSPL